MCSVRAFSRSARSILLAPTLTLAIAVLGSLASAQSQTPLKRLPANQQAALQEKLNGSTVVMATGHPTTSYFAMAHDIASMVVSEDGVRLLPLSGEGGIGTLRDLLYLRGVDLAIVPANVLVRMRETEALGPAVAQRIGYVTRLYNEEVHVVAGPGINAFNQLRGKKIAVAQNDGNALFTLNDLMEHLEIEIVKMPAPEALAAVRAGEIAAVLLIGAKPMPLVSEIAKDGSLRLLNIPFAPALEESYGPTAFRAEDYPNIVPPGVVVESLTISAVLVAGARDREGSAQRVAKLVPALLSAISERPTAGAHSGWGQVNLAATLPTWTRLPAAEEWLKGAQQEQSLALQRTFDAFLREKQPAGGAELTPAQRKKLFDEFVRWTRRSVGETRGPSR
jgi:TRAP-type uncharacterized transport system substrate-binding protein